MSNQGQTHCWEKTNTDNNKQLYGFVYKPRDACDESKSQDAQKKMIASKENDHGCNNTVTSRSGSNRDIWLTVWFVSWSTLMIIDIFLTMEKLLIIWVPPFFIANYGVEKTITFVFNIRR